MISCSTSIGFRPLRSNSSRRSLVEKPKLVGRHSSTQPQNLFSSKGNCFKWIEQKAHSFITEHKQRFVSRVLFPCRTPTFRPLERKPSSENEFQFSKLSAPNDFQNIFNRDFELSNIEPRIKSALTLGTTTTIACALIFGSYTLGFARAEGTPPATNFGIEYVSERVTEDKPTKLIRYPQLELSEVNAILYPETESETEAESKAPEVVQFSDAEVIEEAWKVVDENYLPARGREFDRAQWRTQLDKALKRPPSDRTSAYQSVRSMLQSLNDPYTRFVSPGEFQRMGKYDITGVGLNLVDAEAKDGRPEVRVLGLVTESTASQAGVKQGDVVLEVDGESTAGLSAFQMATRIQGPAKTEVRLKVRHPESGVVEEIVCMRMQGVTSPVSFRKQDSQTGVITLREFNGLAGRDVAAAVRELEGQGVQRFILDLRDNGGGLVQAAQEIVRLFTGGDTTVVFTEYRADRQGLEGPPIKAVRTRGDEALSNAPLIVLVNSRTASASEIVSGALKDNCRAALVGNRTYGKGLIQAVYELSDGSGLVITVGKYLTPGNMDIDQHGIIPDFQTFPGFEAAQQKLSMCVRPQNGN